jgi:class 3 adenylate cyclase
MVEAKKHGHVLVGNSARSLNTRQKAGDPDPINTVHFGRIIIDSIWRIKQDCEKVPYVYQTSDIVPNEESLIEEFFDDDDIKKSILSGGQDAGQLHSRMTWQAVQKILDGSDRPNTAGRAIDRQTWDEEIGCEMQMTVEERFGISLNDHVLQGLSEEDLEDLHLEIEASVRSLMIKHFFGNYFRLLTLLSPCKYRYGVYDQVVPASSLNLPDESEEFLSPLECLLSSFPYARSWFAQGDKRKQKKFEDTDVSLREKIKKEAVSHLQLATGSNKSVAITAARDSRRLSANQRSGSTSRLSGLSAPPGFSKRNPGSVHACLYNSEADDLQHFYTDTRPDLDEIINPSTSLNRTIRIGEHSMTHDYSLHSNIIKSVRIKPDSLRCKNAPLSPGLQKGYTSLKGCFVPVNIDGIDGGKSDQPARGLQKYSSDSRCLDNCPLRFCYSIIALYAVMLCIVNEELHLNTDVAKPSYIFGFLSLNFLILYISERKYDNVVCVILLIFRCLLTISIMPYLANGTDDVAICSGVQYLQGSVLLVFGLWFPIALRQSFLLNCVELLVHTMGILLLRGPSGHHTNCKPRIGASKILPVVAILLILFWAIEYLCIVSYVIENILAPEAQALYQREYVHAREILHACSPNTQPDKSKHLYCPRRYRCCSILAVHVKAADVLPGLVDSLSVASFMKEIMLLIEGCVKECGLLKVTNFSGIFVAACPDLVDDNSPVNYITRTVMCLRKIQAKLDAFSRRNSVNVSVGAGMSSGPVTMGLLGNTRFCFDVCGATRDLAIFMACHQNDGIFASEIFGPYIRDGQLSDDLVMREVQVTSGHKSMKWLQLDGAFNKGMQLDDFEYMCMLGRGGFGSVHLLWENATEKEYAIKAIPRKKGSAIPKMIQREFIILQQIQHANVVSFKCCIINKSMIYLVMSYVRGGNLKQIVERNKPDLKHLTLWFAELVLALNYIHSLGIIHRDVKPANCMIGEL